MKIRLAPLRPNVLFLGSLLAILALIAMVLELDITAGLAIGALAVGFGKLSD